MSDVCFISGVTAPSMSRSNRLKMCKEELSKEIKKYFLRSLYFQIHYGIITIMSVVLVFGQLTCQEEDQKINIEKFILSRNGTCRLVISPQRGEEILHLMHEIFIEDYISVLKRSLSLFFNDIDLNK